MLGTALIFTGGFEAGRELVAAAADLAESLPEVSGESRTYLGRSLRLAGYHDRALVVLEEEVVRARSEGSLGLLSMHSPVLRISSWNAAGGRRLPMSSTKRFDWLAKPVRAPTRASLSAP